MEESLALDSAFLPVEIDTTAMERPAVSARMNGAAVDPVPTVVAQRVDIALSDGRYPLPGPDLHRLERASLAWRTSF